MIFDTHAHYDDEAFNEDRDTLLRSMAAGGVDTIVNVGANMETSRNTIALAQQYPFVYGAVGVHPSEVKDLSESDMEQLEQWCSLPKIVAVGEIGLDYHYPEPTSEVQAKWFLRQLELAGTVRKPVIIHSRDAAADTLALMKKAHAEEIGGVVHCFSYTKEMALEYLKLGFFIGIGGVLTFTNAKKLAEAVSVIPMDRIVLETDCPYLAPVPDRGSRNSSLKLPYVAQKLAELKGLSYDETVNITSENAHRLYRL